MLDLFKIHIFFPLPFGKLFCKKKKKKEQARYQPADELGRDLANDASGSAPSGMCKGAWLVRGRGGRPIVGCAAALPELLTMEGASAGATSGKACAVRGAGANTVCGRGGSRRPLRGAVGQVREAIRPGSQTTSHLLSPGV